MPADRNLWLHICTDRRGGVGRAHLGLGQGEHQLLHALLGRAWLPLLAHHRHEVVTVTAEGNDRLVGVGGQRVLPKERKIKDDKKKKNTV